MRILELDVHVTRGDAVESWHRVHAAVVQAGRGLVASAREPTLVTSWRSCAKPFQVMPMLESNDFEELGWGDDELALACASHGGEPEHVAVAGSMLRDIGLEEGDLACGPHEPLSKRGARLLRESGAPPSRLHNNCSGKHAAMLGRAHARGWEMHGYERDGHSVQAGCLESVATWAAMDVASIGRAVDGCGVVVFSLPLERMAAAYAALAEAVGAGNDVPSRVVSAMRTRPFLVGGSERFDSVLIEESGGEIVSKVGAEGVHSATVVSRGIGVAIKVEDGATRAQYPALLRLLQRIEALPEVLPPRLQEFARTRVRNTRGEIVGDVRPADG
jgi:L-asparaginase II